jgi:DNA-binding MarR family transcriptional regulator
MSATFADATLALVRSGVDLNLRQLGVLIYANGYPDWSVLDYAQALDLNKPAITRALDRLEQDGLAHRIQSRTDRRKIQVMITTDGQQLLARAANGAAA